MKKKLNVVLEKFLSKLENDLKSNIKDNKKYFGLLSKINSPSETLMEYTNEFRKEALKRFIEDESKTKEDMKDILFFINKLDSDSLKSEGEVVKRYGFDSKESLLAHYKTVSLNKCNVELIESIINRFGWLNESEVGVIPNQTLWIIIQHSDIETQTRFYPLMEEEMKKGNLPKSQFAKLQDRMLVNTGRNQIYGTQFQLNPDFTYSLYPIDDIEGVNARREEVGLEPLDMEENITISR